MTLLEQYKNTATNVNSSRTFYRPVREYFDPAQHYVEEIANETVAKRFILQHHYARSFPAAIASFGLFRKAAVGSAELVGVATFSVPMNISHALQGLLREGERVCELGRFGLLPVLKTPR